MGTSRTRANRKYNDLAYDRVAIRVHKGTRSRWHDAAAARGLSLAALIVTAVTEYIQTHPPDESPADPIATPDGSPDESFEPNKS